MSETESREPTSTLAGHGNVDVVVLGVGTCGEDLSLRWGIVAGSHLFLGGTDKVVALDTATGKVDWSGEVEGEIAKRSEGPVDEDERRPVAHLHVVDALSLDVQKRPLRRVRGLGAVRADQGCRIGPGPAEREQQKTSRHQSFQSHMAWSGKSR